MWRIRQPLSDRGKTFWLIVGVSAMLAWYGYVSHKQHVRNPKDTTIPTFTQLGHGLIKACTPQKNPFEAKVLESRHEERPSWLRWWTKLEHDIESTMIVRDLWTTYKRLFIGLSLGIVVSFVIGILMGCYEWIGALFNPLFSFLTQVPGTAMLAVFFVLLGTGETMFIGMIAFGVLPTLAQTVYLSAKHDLHDEDVNKAYTLGASSFEVIWNVVIPMTMPKVIESIRLQLGPAMVCLIAAELLVGSYSGIGFQIRVQQRLLNMAIVYDYLIIMGLIGLMLNKAMLMLRIRLCPWYDKKR